MFGPHKLRAMSCSFVSFLGTQADAFGFVLVAAAWNSVEGVVLGW